MHLSNPLPPNQQLVAPGKWPVVGEKAPRAGAAPWSVTVSGLVDRPCIWSLEELTAMPQVERVIDIHCVTRWSKLGARFSGVPLRALLERCVPLPAARYLSFIARSEREHSTSLPLTEALELDALIVLSHEGEPLEEIHGGPVRMVVPGRYFYKSVKWLERIELLEEDRLGYWEAEAGYHNVADPWREERYIASQIDRRRLREALDSRDFRGLDLLGIDASGRDLAGLDASFSMLRNADFQRTNLVGACFDGANLSNAHLEGADLRNGSFINADVEGADFRSADLRGANFTGASLFGASFCPDAGTEDHFGPAIIDESTLILPEALEALTPTQQEFVRARLKNA